MLASRRGRPRGAARRLLHRLPRDRAPDRRADPRGADPAAARPGSPRSTRSPSAATTTSPAWPSGSRSTSSTARRHAARIGLGGVAATPVRALATEAALEGRPWTQETVEAAAVVLARRGHADGRPPRQRGVPLRDARAALRKLLGELRRPRRCRHEQPVASGPPTPWSARRSRTRAPRCTSPAPPSTPMTSWAGRKDVPARVAGPGAPRARAGHRPAGRPGVRRRGRGARADRRRRARGQRRRRQARRAAVPDRGDVSTATPSAGCSARRSRPPGSAPTPSRSTTSRCRRSSTVREAIAADSFQGGRPHVAAGDVEAALGGAAHVFSGETEMAGQEHFYLETHCSPGARRRGRPGLRAEQHPAPDRDPGDRRPRARSAQPRRHRAVPADGRRLRRQGDAAARVRRDRGARRDAHRPPGPAAAQPHPGHDHDRQAARLPRPVAGRASTTTAGCRRSTPR